ncbi:MAG TPA: hypothetical protein ENH05_09880 [Rhizobiales bacterium]|nr:hypothetical protein BMS3Bbin10_02736 [bacterium BMS3Bbin10]HDO53029.1 hypothetical protein [Hyphomicrobiales bacterium]
MSSDPKSSRGFFLIVVLVNAGLVAWWWLSQQQISHENGPIENLQAITLLVTFALFCMTAAKDSGVVRTAAIALAASSFLLLVREIDLRAYIAPEWRVTASAGAKQLMWLVAASTLVYVLTRYRHLLKVIRSSLTPEAWKAWAFYLWLPLLIVSQLIEEWTDVTRLDDRYAYWASGQFWEEIFELNAYLVFLYTAYLLKIAGRRSRAARASADAMRHAPRSN